MIDDAELAKAKELITEYFIREKLQSRKEYASLKEMNEQLLPYLDFCDLVYSVECDAETEEEE